MIEIKLFKSASLKGYTFIEGFPGVGLVGPMAISYIIDKLAMKYVGYLESDSFPPLISIHKSEPMPAIRVYSDDTNKMITIFAEFAIPIELVAELSRTVYKFIHDNQISKIYSIGGVPTSNVEKIPYAIASDSGMMKLAIAAGMKPIVEGVATGVSANLLVKSIFDNLQDTCIMVPVQQSIIDPIYAETAVQSLNKLMNLNIDVSELDKEAKMVEAKVREVMNKHKESHESYKKSVGEAEGPSMYA